LHEILECTNSGIARCAAIVKAGGVIVFPTDTVYGIGCDPYNDAAVARIFAIKGREEKKPLPVLVASGADAERLVRLGARGRSLAERFWPGALTIIAPLVDRKISPKVTAGKDSLAVRVPSGRCILALLQACRFLVGTSANPSGGSPARDAQEAMRVLAGYDAILIGGVQGGTESTIVDITGPKPEIVREGAIRAQDVLAAWSGK
jgi:L-threonylcarbamoyladenylate synthase